MEFLSIMIGRFLKNIYEGKLQISTKKTRDVLLSKMLVDRLQVNK